MVKTDIILPTDYNTDTVRAAIAHTLGFDGSEITEVQLVKRSLVIRGGEAPHYRATAAFSASEERERGLLKMRKKVSSYPDYSYTPPAFHGDFRPVVVGAGPAGLFAALTLAEAGARPIILERGLAVEERRRKVDAFNLFGILDTECNVQFGEGGAGTYSDGKLKVGSMDKYKMKVLTEFIASGATEDIAFSDTAHLGTDRLSDIVAHLRERIISLGGEFIYSARLTDITSSSGRLVSLTYTHGGESITLPTQAAILAIGHSARDTLAMLYSRGLPMVAKGFGVGVRIEHPREYINRIVYGDSVSLIPDTASYHLVTHLPNGRSVYSFCMCPGGTVVAAASESGGIVTNGMSEYSRMGDNSNAALLVSVTPEDFGSRHPLAGIEYQRGIEAAAYRLTSEYRAPVQRLCDLLEDKSTAHLGEVIPSYSRGTEFVRCDEYLPRYITDSLRASFADFNDWLAGYMYPDATLTGPETRTTSPVRILRDEFNMVQGFHGIFPAGEGAGYAGGIVSSATDGIRTAENLIRRSST